MKKIQIHGKDYVMVKDRIIFFNENFQNGNASEIWKFIYNDMCSDPPIKCPADCVCKEGE